MAKSDEFVDVIAPFDANSISIDSSAGKLYWTQSSSPFAKTVGVWRSNLDGTGTKKLVEKEGGQAEASLALNPARGQLYFTASPVPKDDMVTIVRVVSLSETPVNHGDDFVTVEDKKCSFLACQDYFF